MFILAGIKGVLNCMQATAAACNMFTGAELAGLCREAAITALREDLQVAHLVFLAPPGCFVSMPCTVLLHFTLRFAIAQQHLVLYHAASALSSDCS